MNGLSSPITPFSNYTNSIELLAFKVDLWWTVDVVTKEITFELHMATTGWIGLGISPDGGMPGADIGVGWVNQSGYLTFQDRYAYGYVTPVIDNTTTNWFGLQGREQNGWTAIQFKRLLDTCDSMDYPIKSGSNILIFAWGSADPNPSVSNGDIVYHGDNRSSRVIPLQSYIQPQSEDKYAGLDTVEFRANNYTIPTNQSTYYCKIFKIPNNFPEKRHAIAREILINSSAANLVFHLTLNECDPTSVFDDNNLPQGPCDNNRTAYALCTFNIVIGWATGGDYLIEFPEEAGLPIGLNFSIKYYMLQINYYNADSGANYIDNSGIRLYVGNELRQYDLGGFTLGVDSTPSSMVIPPNVSAFSIDSYCTADASRYAFPQSGLTIVWFFGHTHLQGQSLWTKAIYNQTAIGYLFNAESYYPNHQFENRLPQPFKVYPGNEFATRCVYNTMNKSEVTLGGRLPSQEMCVQVFTYYPRVSNLYACASTIHPISWMTLLNVTVPPTDATISQWAVATNWTSNLTTQWQTFYNTAARITAYGRAGFYNITVLPSLPTYTDLNTGECKYQQTTTITTSTSDSHNLVVHPAAFVLSLFILSLMNGIII